MTRSFRQLFVVLIASIALPSGASAQLGYNFEFTNPPENGGGTVQGVILGLQDDATSAATVVSVTSNTAGFGVGHYVGNPLNNDFTVNAGLITDVNFSSAGGDNTSPAVTDSSLTLNVIGNLGFSGGAIKNQTDFTGVAVPISGLSFTPIVPELIDLNFTFTNPNGGGLVEGIVRGVARSGISSAQSFEITSNTDGYGIGEYIGNPFDNTFTLVDGEVLRANFSVQGLDNSPPDVTDSVIQFLNFAPGGTFALGFQNDNNFTVLAVSPNSDLTFSVVPEPTSLMLLTLGGLLGMRRSRP